MKEMLSGFIVLMVTLKLGVLTAISIIGFIGSLFTGDFLEIGLPLLILSTFLILILWEVSHDV